MKKERVCTAGISVLKGLKAFELLTIITALQLALEYEFFFFRPPFFAVEHADSTFIEKRKPISKAEKYTLIQTFPT